QEVGRRLAEQARDRSRMEAVLGGMVEGVIVVDAQGRLQLVNEAARHMPRLPQPAIGRPYLESIRLPALAGLVAGTLRGGAPERAGARRGGGAAHPLQSSRPREAWGTIIARAARARSKKSAGVASGAAVIVLHDITDLRRADKIRRDFVANVSHELRTPLTA